MFLIERENASSKCHENPTEVRVSIESIMTVRDEISRNREKFVFSDISLSFLYFFLSLSLSFLIFLRHLESRSSHFLLYKYFNTDINGRYLDVNDNNMTESILRVYLFFLYLFLEYFNRPKAQFISVTKIFIYIYVYFI